MSICVEAILVAGEVLAVNVLQKKLTDDGYRKADEVRKETAKEILQYMKNVRPFGGVLNWDIETLAKHYGVEVDE